MREKRVVITGSTRGIGYALADEFLRQGACVLICGRSKETLEKALKSLQETHYSEKVFGIQADVCSYEDNLRLWEEAGKHFGGVDIWINNAGIGQPAENLWDLSTETIHSIVEVNITGHLYGLKVAAANMLQAGHGAIYNLEGLGSNGMVVSAGALVYAASKRAINYMTHAMAKELKGTGVICGSFRPGMTATDFITDAYKHKPEEWKKMRPLFNILSDKPETIAKWFVPRALKNKRNGKIFNWFTKSRALGRFLSSPFRKREMYSSIE